jgi:hypothetical protein
MSSSVSSVRAFSLAGITVSKRRNPLKPDIVEALQVLKCMIRRDLIFRKAALVDDEADSDDDEGKEDSDAEEGWDVLLDEDRSNYDPDYDMDDNYI